MKFVDIRDNVNKALAPIAGKPTPLAVWDGLAEVAEVFDMSFPSTYRDGFAQSAAKVAQKGSTSVKGAAVRTVASVPVRDTWAALVEYHESKGKDSGKAAREARAAFFRVSAFAAGTGGFKIKWETSAE